MNEEMILKILLTLTLLGIPAPFIWFIWVGVGK